MKQIALLYQRENVPSKNSSDEKQFVLVSCNVGNEDLLKEEIKLLFPYLSLSFSKSGLISFKNTGAPLSLLQVSNLDICFARRVSLFCKKCNSDSLLDTRRDLCIEYQTEIIHQSSLIDSSSVPTGLAAISHKNVICQYQLSNDEFWFGVYLHHEKLSPMANSHYEITLPDSSPSRAWLKMCETQCRFSLLAKGDRVLELGSAPGGVSYYLLQHGMKVLAVDPGEMDPICLLDANFKHLKKPVQECVLLDTSAFRAQWLAVDMNLPASFSVHETVRLAQIAQKTLLGLIVTIKMPRPNLVIELKGLCQKLSICGITKYRLVQLEAHKREILFVGLTELGIKRGCDL